MSSDTDGRTSGRAGRPGGASAAGDAAAEPEGEVTPCERWARYLDGRHPRVLPAAAHAQFLRHLPTCPDCRRVAWDHYAARAALARLRPADPGYQLPPSLATGRGCGFSGAPRPAIEAAPGMDGVDGVEEVGATCAADGRVPEGLRGASLLQGALFGAIPVLVAPRPRDEARAGILLVPCDRDLGRSGVGAEIGALFGFRLAALHAGSLPGSHADRISQQALLLTRLDASVPAFPPADRALELRYVARPGRRDGDPGESISCYLLGRLARHGEPPGELLRRADRFRRQVADVAGHILPGYAFEPLARDDLPRALRPFEFADTGEVRPPSPLASATGSLPLLGMPDADAVLDLLARQPAPTLLTIGAGLAEPAQTGRDATAGDTGNAPPPGVVVAISDAAAALTALPELGLRRQHAMAIARCAYRCRVQAASADLLSDALVATLVGEFGGVGRLTAQAAWRDPALPLADGATFVRPRAAVAGAGAAPWPSEYALAEHNLRTLGFARWGDGQPGRPARPSRPTAPAWPLADLGEVARLFALPASARWLQDRGAALPLPFAAGVRAGSRLGRGLAPHGDPRPVLLPAASRPFHTWLAGQTGTGKSTLLEALILQDILAGRGVIAIDPHGDLIGQVLGKVPAERMGDVILFDPADAAYPVGLNPLEAEGEERQALVVSSFIGLLRKLFDPQHTGIVGPRFEHAVRNGLLTVMANPAGGTLIEFVRCFTDPAFVADLLPHVADPLVRRYWTDQIAHTSDFHKSEVLDYVVSKFGPFVTDFTVRRIVGQTRSGFSFREAMDSGKVVLISLAKGKLGATNANFLGLILLPMILQAALSRADLPPAARRETCLYVDEFHNYETDSLALMLAEARKYQLALTLANQHVGQLTGEVRDALVGNVGNVIAFRLGVADAAIMEYILAPSPVRAADLVALPNHTAYGRLLIEGRRTPAFTLRTEPVSAPLDPARAERIRDYSRALYGRERARVDDAIRRRARL